MYYAQTSNKSILEISNRLLGRIFAMFVGWNQMMFIGIFFEIELQPAEALIIQDVQSCD